MSIAHIDTTPALPSIGGSPLFRLTETLSKIDGVEVFPYEDTIINGKLSIYFTYKKGQSSIEEKAKFIDWLARILGNSEYYAGYSTNIAMWWMGNKGIDGENEPFFTIDVLPALVHDLLNVLKSACNIREALPLAFTTNHYDNTINTVKIASIPLNHLWTFAVMSRIATLALHMSVLKSHIFSFFAKLHSSWHTKIIEGDNQECQS